MSLILVVLAGLLACPQELQAQDAADISELRANQPALDFVKKPTTTTCQPDQKCFDFENFKKYLAMRAQYVWLFKHHASTWPAIESALKKSAALHEEAAELHAKRAERTEKAYDDLFPKYEAALLRASRAEAYSVWGGGLPWLITATVVGLAAGAALGVYLETKVSE